jgi:predicted O-methyltransferase YrrM
MIFDIIIKTKKNFIELKENVTFDKDFDYINYQSNIITNKIKKYSGWMLWNTKQINFINGIIRKFRPKKCLEVGVARGGSSILILNAIKDIKNSFLVSLDLNTKLYINQKEKTGYRVKKYFPELVRKWSLFTGEMPNFFLQKLNMTFDLVFLDTAHISPGEIMNLIEILPFLNENAIIILHDITWHFIRMKYQKKRIQFTATQIYLMSCLYGEKIIVKNNEGLENIGAVYLYKNQKRFYLNYFLLLLSYWEYMPNEKQINEFKEFIKKYYHKTLYLKIFDQAVKNNKLFINKYYKSINYKK